MTTLSLPSLAGEGDTINAALKLTIQYGAGSGGEEQLRPHEGEEGSFSEEKAFKEWRLARVPGRKMRELLEEEGAWAKDWRCERVAGGRCHTVVCLEEILCVCLGRGEGSGKVTPAGWRWLEGVASEEPMGSLCSAPEPPAWRK